MVAGLLRSTPFTWACREPNLNSFLLFVRLKQLPRVPTFSEAVAQQRQAFDTEAAAAKSQRELAERITIKLPVTNNAAVHCMFDDA